MRLENQSPLTINQTITADFKILEKVKSFNFTSYNLNIGHTAQFTHDSFFGSFETGDRYSLFDRKVNGFYQDDKCATWYGFPQKISNTHTVSFNELTFWDSEVLNNRDVFINSFEQVKDSTTQFIYKGTLSFKKMRENDIISVGAKSRVPMFYRDLAYNCCLHND